MRRLTTLSSLVLLARAAATSKKVTMVRPLKNKATAESELELAIAELLGYEMPNPTEKQTKQPKKMAKSSKKKPIVDFDDSEFWQDMEREAAAGTPQSISDQAYLQDMLQAMAAMAPLTPAKERSQKKLSGSTKKGKAVANNQTNAEVEEDEFDAAQLDAVISRMDDEVGELPVLKLDGSGKKKKSRKTNVAEGLSLTTETKAELAQSIARLRHYIETNNVVESLPRSPISTENMPAFPVQCEELADASQWLLSPMSASHPLILQPHTPTRRYALNTYPLCPLAQNGERNLTEDEARRVLVEPMSTDNRTTFMVRRSMVLKDGEESAVRVQKPKKSEPVSPENYDANRVTKKAPTDVLKCTLSVYNHRLAPATAGKANSPTSSSGVGFDDKLTISSEASVGVDGSAQHLRVRSVPLYTFYVSSQPKLRPLSEAIVKKRFGSSDIAESDPSAMAENEKDIDRKMRELFAASETLDAKNYDAEESLDMATILEAMKAVDPSSTETLLGSSNLADGSLDPNSNPLLRPLDQYEDDSILHSVSVACVLHADSPMYFAGIDKSSIYRAIYTDGIFSVPATQGQPNEEATAQKPFRAADNRVLGLQAPTGVAIGQGSPTLGMSPTAADIEFYLAQQAAKKK